MKKLKIIFIILISVFASSCSNSVSTNTITGETDTKNNTLENNVTETMVKYNSPELKDGDIIATMKTNNGTIKIKLFNKQVSKTTTNFIALSKKGYYDNVIFHRVIKGFMIQSGDPDGTGMGGESIYGASFEDEFVNELTNIKGTISMANSGVNTNGSQFFINSADNNGLNNKHTVFGQVVEGYDNVEKISKSKTDSSDKPEKEIKIISIDINEYKGGKLVSYDFNLEEVLTKIKKDKADEAEVNKTRVAKNGDIVAVHYTGTLESGDKFDSSYDRNQPIEFTLGSGQMISGFDTGVVGMKIGDKKTLNLEAKDAYGEYDEKNIQDVPKKDLEDAGFTIEVGAMIPTMYGEFKILEVGEETVKMDMNSRLAGKNLNFDIELVDYKN